MTLDGVGPTTSSQPASETRCSVQGWSACSADSLRSSRDARRTRVHSPGHAQCWAEQLTVETPRRDPPCSRQGTEQQARPRSEMCCWQRRLMWWSGGRSTDGRVPWLEPGSPASDASARCLASAAASARPQPPST
ncbi:hypothetical protein HPB52_016961 [Rhipicephalus sanguineus]|uniref:Uncharacterized protein n=1 Tax=Rhipicephalus sanguineus TaxID=34632 RepID=A0A9D4PS48_RHISA|nr:hypothetical protein HPB52_016961 [Rhipicephalus sanguineus]